MVETINLIIGGGIIILNLIPFIFKKPKLLFLTVLVSFLMAFLLSFFKI